MVSPLSSNGLSSEWVIIGVSLGGWRWQGQAQPGSCKMHHCITFHPPSSTPQSSPLVCHPGSQSPQWFPTNTYTAHPEPVGVQTGCPPPEVLVSRVQCSQNVSISGVIHTQRINIKPHAIASTSIANFWQQCKPTMTCRRNCQRIHQIFPSDCHQMFVIGLQKVHNQIYQCKKFKKLLTRVGM